MKPKLFESNLTVHKLLGEVSEDECEVRRLAVDSVKEQVLELYQVWDSSMAGVSQQLLGVEDGEKQRETVQSDLAGVSSFLRRESGRLVSALTSTDSGISDSSSEAARLGREISQQEKRLVASQQRMKGLRGGRGLRRDLAESGRQLALLRSLLVNTRHSSQAPGSSRRRRGRLLIYWLTTCWLVLVLVLLLVVARPRCCDHSNLSYFFLVQYSGGARPI